MLGEMTAQGTGRVGSSMNSNINPGTMGRPKSAHILSQLSPPAHPSNPQWTVTPLNSPGTTHIPCLLLRLPPCLHSQPILPSYFSSVSPSLYCNLSCLFSPESWVLWSKREQTRRALVTFSSITKKHRSNSPMCPCEIIDQVFPVNTIQTQI